MKRHSPGSHKVLSTRRDPPPSDLEGRASRFANTVGGKKFTETFEQGFRIEDTTLERYELYVGVDAPPDFDASSQPVATSPTLPFSWTPVLPSSGNATLHLVVRKRNRFGLKSFNVFETKRVFAAHMEVLPPVAPPRNVEAFDDQLGYLRIVGKYLSTDNPVGPADKWELYVKIGSDPVPGVDTPVYTGDMEFMGVEAGFAQTSGPWTPGTIVHVILVALRSSDSARGAAAVVLKTLATIPDLPEGFMFGGDHFEQD